MRFLFHNFNKTTISLCIFILACGFFIYGKEAYGESCIDPLTDVTYIDCPPKAILDQGIGIRQKSAILSKWRELDTSSKTAIKEYLKNQQDGKEQKLLEEQTLRELQHKTALKEFLGLWTKAFGRLGLSTSVISIDAAAQAYLAGRLVIDEQVRPGAGGDSKRQQMFEAEEAERLAQTAAKRLQYTQSLEQEFVNLARTRQARLANEAGTPLEPWLVHEGEGKLPASARKASAGRPMVLDPNESKTYLYVVKEDGTLVYAPQHKIGNLETVKHTDLVWGQGNKARIGGELNYENGKWIMDNNSGRFSGGRAPPGEKYSDALYTTRTVQNLEAAAELARNTGTTATIETKWNPNYKEFPPAPPHN